MAFTKDIAFLLGGARRDTGRLGYVHYGYNVRAVGYEYDGVVQSYYVAGFTPAYNPQSSSQTMHIERVTLTIQLYGGSGSVCVGTLSQKLGGQNNQTWYTVLASVPARWTLTANQTHVIEVTDEEEIQKVLTYGVGIRPASSAQQKTEAYLSATYTYSDTAEPPTIKLTSYPLSIFLCDDIPLAWEYSQSADLAQSKVDIAIFRDDNDAPSYKIAENMPLSEQQYTANLRDTDIINPEMSPDTVWRIGMRAYSAASDTPSAWSIGSPVKLKDLLAALVSPIGGARVFATEAVTLRWKLKETPTGNPYKFGVAWSADGGESYKRKELLYGDTPYDGDTWSYTIPAGELPHGVVKWYVVVWTTKYSSRLDWKYDTFTAVIQASTSAVTCDGKPLPTLTWEATAQAAFQIRFADYDSGAVYGEARSFRVPYIYEDGLYAVQVRTQTTAGDWSDWSEVQYVQITNIPPDNDFGREIFQVQKTARAVRLDCIFWGDYRAYVFYRDGVPIYCGEDGGYTDTAANGTAEYTARAVTEDGYYFEFEKITIDTTPDVDCLYSIADAQWIDLQYSAAPRRRQFSENSRVSYHYYSGRKKPIAFTEGFRERTGSFSYCFTDARDAKKLEEMSGKEVLYKGKDGSMIRGVLNGVSHLAEIIHDMTFTVTETDYNEAVPYAVE